MVAASSCPALGVQELKAPCFYVSSSTALNSSLTTDLMPLESHLELLSHVLCPALEEIMQLLLCKCETYLEQTWNFVLSWG